MRKICYLIIICFISTACSKDKEQIESSEQIIRRDLSPSEIILKSNLQSTAKIFASLISDTEIKNELKAITSGDRKSNILYFDDLLNVGSKESISSFKILREKFLSAISSKSMTNRDDLATYLANNQCYLYCPYPDDFYSKEAFYTVASHPIDNEYEGVGYRIDESGNMIEIKVNEKYTDKNPVFIIMPNDLDKETNPVDSKRKAAIVSDTINEIKIGFIRCADYCGGLFEGALELRVGRGYPSFNSETEILTGSFTTVIPIDYPRSYAKAAINNWTQHSNGGWYPVNIVWDSNWRTSKTQQCVIVYEYDQTNAVSTSADVGYKNDTLNTELKTTATTTYRGDFLGISEWDRDWFFATYYNHGSSDEVKDGIIVRKTSPALKITTPLRKLVN